MVPTPPALAAPRTALDVRPRTDAGTVPDRPAGLDGRTGLDALQLLAGRGSRPAVLTADGELSYADLAQRAGQVARALGPVRRLVRVTARNDADALAGYLGALAGGHAVLLVPDGRAGEALAAAWDPDAVVTGLDVRAAREGTAHDLHPDLALLLSTSGSTGSPKLVRLSRRNLLANAQAVVTSLGIGAGDRALTALPLSYCYGLSVVHSHLLAGGSLVLTDRSVTDEALWDLARRTGATTLPGVPYTFELLERTGFADRLARGELPALRTLTQAGGKMPPERVRAFASLPGVDLHVMYGATEATARMAVLPPELALTRAEAVGLPVPGSAFRLEPVEGAPEGVGELVLSGPGVMMGYATSPADLARGPELTELRTGDLARQAPDGLWEVVGRRSRIAKPFGVRLDLDHVEQRLLAGGLDAWCCDGGGELVVALEGDVTAAQRRRARVAAVGVTGLPPAAVRVVALPVRPRTASGKPDRAALLAALQQPDPAADAPPTGVHALLAEVLDVPVVRDEDSFAGLGGDSLSYVEAAVRLEALLGDLPPDWHRRPVGSLVPRPAAEPGAASRGLLDRLLDRTGLRTRLVRADLPLLLRGLAIVLVVGTHADLFEVLGGAHLLLAVAGYNLARFQGSLTSGRSRAVLRSTGRVVAPSVVWIAGATLVLGWYPWTSALLLNWLVGPEQLGRPWELWFLEALVVGLLGTAALLAVPAVDRLERARPFGCALAAVLLALAVREAVRLQPGAVRVYGVLAVGWLLALGWAAARSSTRAQRLVVSVVAVVAVPPFFVEAPRGAVVVAGLLALVWVRTVRLPAPAVRALAVLAGASLYVYLAHWQVFPQLEVRSPLLAVLASFAAGLAFQQAWERGRDAVLRRVRAQRVSALSG